MMTGKQKDFKTVISGILAGNGCKINGMYVEYSDSDTTANCARDLEYFQSISAGGKSGYARVAVSNAYSKDGKAHYQALLSCEDFEGASPVPTGKIVAATLVCMPDEKEVNDMFVYTAVFKSPVCITNTAYTTIDICLNIGD